MPALIPTDLTACVVWLGCNRDLGAALETEALSGMVLGFLGPAGRAMSA